MPLCSTIDRATQESHEERGSDDGRWAPVDVSAGELARLASFPEQNPNPVIETDFAGRVTYCNPAARREFPDLHELGQRHPILDGMEPMVAACQVAIQGSVTREIGLAASVYEQKICCITESGLIRIFVYDLTERKALQERLARANEELERRVEERTAALHESETRRTRVLEQMLAVQEE